MRPPSPLCLYEEILLLALDDDKGTLNSSLYNNAMGGAILAELVMDGAVRLADDKHKKISSRPNAEPRDAILAESYRLVCDSRKERPATHWVMKFAATKDLYHRTARQLVSRGLLTEETGTVLKFFKRQVFPEADGKPEQELIKRLEAAIFTGTPRVDQRTVIIITLAQATGLLARVIDKKRLKTRKDRLEKLTNGQLVGQATKEAVAAIQSAILVATIIPAVTATH